MRLTKAEQQAFERDWLSQPHRCGHQWVPDNPRCTACGRKFGKAAGAICPKRRKPNRWRLHLSRAWLHAQYPPEVPKTDRPAWILSQLNEVRQGVRQAGAFAEDPRFWKYHRLARRYRALLRRWWAEFPGARAPQEADRPREYGIPQGRAKLLRQVEAQQTPVVQVGGCTYRFYPEAQVADRQGRLRPLFTEEAPCG